MKETSNVIVSIIIATSGAGGYLKKCLGSCLIQSFKNFELIVIDNSSNNSLSAEIQRLYPGVKLFRNPQPLSYCQSLNLGIISSVGEFVFCLNDDVTLEKDYLEKIRNIFSLDEKIGAVCGKILRSNAKTIDTTGLFLSYCRTAKERGYGKKDRHQYEKPGFVFGVNGAVLFCRREMLEEIKEPEGYFDPLFNFFYEDLDLAWRALRAGWKAYYTPDAIAYHVRGGSFRLDSKGIDQPFARRYLSEERHLDLIKNRYLTIIKNERLVSFLLHLPGILAFECLQWGYCLFRRPRLLGIFSAHLKYFPAAFKKRKILFGC